MGKGFGAIVRKNMVKLSTFSTVKCGKQGETGVDMAAELVEKLSERAELWEKCVGNGGIMSFFGDEVISIFHRVCGKARHCWGKSAGC